MRNEKLWGRIRKKRKFTKTERFPMQSEYHIIHLCTRTYLSSYFFTLWSSWRSPLSSIVLHFFKQKSREYRSWLVSPAIPTAFSSSFMFHAFVPYIKIAIGIYGKMWLISLVRVHLNYRFTAPTAIFFKCQFLNMHLLSRMNEMIGLNCICSVKLWKIDQHETYLCIMWLETTTLRFIIRLITDRANEELPKDYHCKDLYTCRYMYFRYIGKVRHIIKWSRAILSFTCTALSFTWLENI